MKAESSKVKAQSSKLERIGGGMKFGYEDLVVWNRAVSFSVNIIDVVENVDTDRKHYRLLEQIEAASTSVSMNLAEGKGRFSKKEFIHYC